MTYLQRVSGIYAPREAGGISNLPGRKFWRNLPASFYFLKYHPFQEKVGYDYFLHAIMSKRVLNSRIRRYDVTPMAETSMSQASGNEKQPQCDRAKLQWPFFYINNKTIWLRLKTQTSAW